jgi:hypothetical protein
MLRENYSDEIVCYDTINEDIVNVINDKKFEFLFFEADVSSYNNYIVSYNITIGTLCVSAFIFFFYPDILVRKLFKHLKQKFLARKISEDLSLFRF